MRMDGFPGFHPGLFSLGPYGSGVVGWIEFSAVQRFMQRMRKEWGLRQTYTYFREPFR